MLSPLHGVYPIFTNDLAVDVYPIFVFGEPAPVPTPPDILLRITRLFLIVLGCGELLLEVERRSGPGGVCAAGTEVRLVESRRSTTGGAT